MHESVFIVFKTIVVSYRPNLRGLAARINTLSLLSGVMQIPIQVIKPCNRLQARQDWQGFCLLWPHYLPP